MNPEHNKAAKRRYVDAFNAGNLDVFDELFAPNYVLHVPGAPDIEGPGALKEMVAGSLESLSDVALTVEDMVAEGDRVATRWTLTALHTGDFMGVAPTTRRITIRGMIMDRFVDGRVVEAWDSFDAYGVLTQLGAIPSAGGSVR
jgi:predicted ester cyclase